VTRDSSKSPPIDDVESELDDNEHFDNYDYEIESEEDIIFTRAFMSGSLEDLDKLYRYKDTPLDVFFLLLVNPMNQLFTLKIKIMNSVLILR
jgi:hypothetical protein